MNKFYDTLKSNVTLIDFFRNQNFLGESLKFDLCVNKISKIEKDLRGTSKRKGS